jgi:predicted NAD-dependent protein-ADP-ribosyltransferase YbiA (DUF1768 family)
MWTNTLNNQLQSINSSQNSQSITEEFKNEVLEIIKTQIYNIASNSQNPIEAWLSNLYHNPFTFNWVNYASIEAFWQSIKFSEWSKEWQECITLSWLTAKKYWDKAEKREKFTYNWKEYIFWSPEHQNLMKEALREQLKQNPDKLKLLLDTWNANIIHQPLKKDWTPYPDSTTIPWKVFSRFLMELREELYK